MNLEQIISELDLQILTKQKQLNDINPEVGYVSDLLSCVIAGAPHHCVWVTIQAHPNIVAVAALAEISAVIITEGAQPDETTIAKANEEGITLLSTPKTSFFVVGKLWEAGIRV